MSHNPKLINYQTNINTSSVTVITRPSGATITNSYDKGRLVSTTTPEGTTSYSYLFANQVGAITKGTESFSFTYDGTLLTAMSQSGVLNHTSDLSYNNDFQVTSTTYAGATQAYSYDNDGLLISIGGLANPPYTLTRETDNGFVTQLTDGTLTQNRSYNSYGELTELSDNTFTYQLSQRDHSGAITQKVETLNGTTETFNYTYDDLGRLIEARRVGASHQTVEQYTYDNNGNRASATINNQTTTAQYTLDDQLEVYGNDTYRYNDDGYLIEKMTAEGTTTYDYGTLGELKEVVTPTKTITYLQNANNQRVAKLVDGTITEKYLWANLTTLLAHMTKMILSYRDTSTQTKECHSL
jgi:YD repeat-containing protein